MSRTISPLKRIRFLLEYALIRLLAWAVALPPRGVQLRMGRALGALVYHLLPGRRAIARENIERALSDRLSAEERERVLRGSFASFGRLAVDAMWSFSRTKEELLKWVSFDEEGSRAAERFIEEGRGGIFALGHFGNWEIMNLAWGAAGRVPQRVVAKRLHNPYLDSWLRERRERTGNRMIPARRAARDVLRELRANTIVAIVMDQDTPPRYGGIFVPFFGEPAATTKAVASFSLGTGAPVLVVSCLPQSDGRYRVHTSAPIDPEATDDRGADLVQWTTRYNEMLEHEIMRAPEHYLWMHKRWKTKPPRSEDPQAAG